MRRLGRRANRLMPGLVCAALIVNAPGAAQAAHNGTIHSDTAGPVAQSPAGGDRWDPAAPPSPNPLPANTSQWDTTLPMVPSANVAGDPVAVVNAVLQISATSAHVTADMGRKFLTKLGILSEPAAAIDPGITNGRIPRVYGQQASELVIRRAMSQLGVPYSWGGGNANGPSRGIDQGANTVGFDCSGLYLYAFAGVGIKLPHYSGDQYNAGRKIPSSQMRRGDLIFYGPNASQHEAMYLGNGQMLEAPYTGSQVRVVPVRAGGMMPYVTRLIEY
jgi:peptidoglycan DL-endopeptidase RipA